VAPRIVDAHTHLFPERLAAAIRAFFVQHVSGDVFDYPLDWREAQAVLQASGVGRCWALPYVRRPQAARGLNRWMAETFADNAFVEPGATVHPGDDVRAVVEEALGPLQLRLVKLHCSVGDFSLTDERLEPLWRRLSGSGTPAVIHLGHSIGGNTEAAELAELDVLAQRWPDLPLILAHCGAPAVAPALALLRRHPNLYADLTPVISQLVPLVPGAMGGLEERLLFGSDMPNVVARVDDALAAIRTLGLSAQHLALVLGGNADRLVPPPRVSETNGR
jgi:uncharacterized protein